MSGQTHAVDVATIAGELVRLFGQDDDEARLTVATTNLFTHDAHVTRDEIGARWGQMAWLLAQDVADLRNVPLERVIESAAGAWTEEAS